MNEVWTLLWKEYRNNTQLILVGFAVLFLPVLIVMSLVSGSGIGIDDPLSKVINKGLIYGGTGGLILSQFLLLCLGGHLIGGERSTRSFEFLFNQPVSRRQIIASKLIFAFLWVSTIWAIGGLMILIGIQFMPPERGVTMDDIGETLFAEIAATGAMLFGASWLASNKVDDSVLAMAIGVVASGAVFLFLQYLGTHIDSPLKSDDVDWTRIIAFSLISITTTALGVRIFVGRRAP